jgi:hypothetical protein
MAARTCLFALAAVAILGAIPAAAVDGLKMPSGNIVCTVQDPDANLPGWELRCDTRNFRPTKDRPPKDCPLGWGDGYAIGQTGKSERICHGDTIMHEDVMVLPYGMTWRHGPYTCRAQPSGLTCFNTQGHGFSLSKASQRLF